MPHAAAFRPAAMRGLAFAVAAAAALAGCTPEPFPEAERPADRTGPPLAYPAILPLEGLLAQARPAPADAADPDPDLRRRGDALRARAEAVRAQQL